MGCGELGVCTGGNAINIQVCTWKCMGENGVVRSMGLWKDL